LEAYAKINMEFHLILYFGASIWQFEYMIIFLTIKPTLRLYIYVAW